MLRCQSQVQYIFVVCSYTRDPGSVLISCVWCCRHVGDVCFWRRRMGGGGGGGWSGGEEELWWGKQCSLHGVHVPHETELHLCSDRHDGVVHHIRVLVDMCPAALVLCPLDDARAPPLHTDVIALAGRLWQPSGHLAVCLQLPLCQGSPWTVPKKRWSLQGTRLKGTTTILLGLWLISYLSNRRFFCVFVQFCVITWSTVMRGASVVFVSGSNNIPVRHLITVDEAAQSSRSW